MLCQVRSCYVMLGQITSDYIKLCLVISALIRLVQFRSGYNMFGQVFTRYINLYQVSSG
jgi:hypothetical protein